ncbi:MAG: hypothetical protein LBK60_11315 [Verrucomicrobiales bacterium]|jgi:hypothetical protein|nr:hypothetical protein [Verrucomicrobiales bacterium]
MTTIREWVQAVREELNRRGKNVSKSELAKWLGMTPEQLANACSQRVFRFPQKKIFGMMAWAVKESVFPNELAYVILEHYCPGIIKLTGKPTLIEIRADCGRALERAIKATSPAEVTALLDLFAGSRRRK